MFFRNKMFYKSDYKGQINKVLCENLQNVHMNTTLLYLSAIAVFNFEFKKDQEKLQDMSLSLRTNHCEKTYCIVNSVHF